MLYAPAVGSHLQRLGAALRYESSLPDEVREGVICLVARGPRINGEDSAPMHRRPARRASTRRCSRCWRGATCRSRLAPRLRLAHALLTGNEPAGDPIADLGPERVFEVSALLGYYTTLAWQLRLFGVEAPEVHDG